MEDKLKLNIGCGGLEREGYIGVDFQRFSGVDKVHDLNYPLPYEDVDEIYASHIIEHFWYFDIMRILTYWHHALKPGGMLEIWTVDFDVVIEKHNRLDSEGWNVQLPIKGKGNDAILKDFIVMNKSIFSNNLKQGNAHHCIFTKVSLKELLLCVGFKSVEFLELDDFPFRPLHDAYNMGVRAYK